NLRRTTWWTTQETKAQYVTNSIIHGNAKVRSSPRHYGWRTISDDGVSIFGGLRGGYCYECMGDTVSSGGSNYSLLMVLITTQELLGRIMDAYLAEIARDPYLSLQKFTAIIE
ncbi:hypothetical protein HID58_086137, partial [Brassica napus]